MTGNVQLYLTGDSLQERVSVEGALSWIWVGGQEGATLARPLLTGPLSDDAERDCGIDRITSQKHGAFRASKSASGEGEYHRQR